VAFEPIDLGTAAQSLPEFLKVRWDWGLLGGLGLGVAVCALYLSLPVISRCQP